MKTTILRITSVTIFLFSIFITSAYSAAERGMAIRPTAPTGEEVKGDLWLLTIGIDSYLSWPRLKTAANDARSVRDVLLRRYHLDNSRTIELINEKATRHNILNSFRELATKVKPEDSLLVYYAGHGHIDPITGKGSWIPVESGTDDPTAWIDNRNITDYLNINAIKAKHVLMVSDSCFSGDFFRGSRGALPTIDDAFLKKAYQRSSRQAISSGGLEPVSDSGFGGNSVFSHFLVAALKNNSKDYLIPSEIFSEVRAGVGKNADQLPQFGDLHGTGGQEGGELILFLKQENRLQGLSADAAARQKELERLRQMEQSVSQSKQQEQAEITKREQELKALDQQIAEMKGRLGTSAARTSDSLDQMIAMVEQKEAQARNLETLRQQRNAEEQRRRQEIEGLKQEAQTKRLVQIKTDLAKYEKIASSSYGHDLKGSAWDALVATYPETKKAARYDVDGFLATMNLGQDGGEVIALVEKKRRDEKRERIMVGEFIAVPGGCFQMGDNFSTIVTDDESHKVCINNFYIGKYEVTQQQWQMVMGNNPSYSKDCGPDCPVENVSWNNTQEFIGKLNAKTGKRFRLPTEAEWEYAARSGGKKEKYAGGENLNNLAWHDRNSGRITHRVGTKKPNGLGLYDMTGNVSEWCQDWYGAKYYDESPRDNPQGPSSGQYRVLRGGDAQNWDSGEGAELRAATRLRHTPESSNGYSGFRLAVSAP